MKEQYFKYLILFKVFKCLKLIFNLPLKLLSEHAYQSVHSSHSCSNGRTTSFSLYTWQKDTSLSRESHGPFQNKELLQLFNLGHLKKIIRKKPCFDCTWGFVVMGIWHRYLDTGCDLGNHVNVPSKVLEQDALEISQYFILRILCVSKMQVPSSHD